jgi:hypothetical protein
MIYSLASSLYQGLTVCYSYLREKREIHYDSFGAFIGGTPAILEITIEDVKAGDTSIIDYLSGMVLEGLQQEVASLLEK